MEPVTTLPRGGPFTRRDLEGLPDDGRRYEAVDGALVVTPAPSRRHQLASSGLQAVLTEACPESLDVLSAPLDLELKRARFAAAQWYWNGDRRDVVPGHALAGPAGPPN
jgi:hypothetical protein